jgi:hypothetical protein
VTQTCEALRAYVPVCINVQGYVYTGPYKGNDYLDASAIPVPIVPGVVSTCKRFVYEDANGGGPTLAQVLQANNLTLEGYKSLNGFQQPVGVEPAMIAGYWHCVAA